VLLEAEVRTYISEPERGRRNWKERLAQPEVYGNRRRIGGEHGKELLRRRGDCRNAALQATLEAKRLNS